MNKLTEGQKLIVIVGPTASGKSDLGIKLAKKLRGEIISGDSRQIYRGMDIGTGEVTKREQKMVRHHLLDVASPKRIFTASDFKKLGERAIKDLASKNKIPIIVGGTGFYIDILLGRMQAAQVKPNKQLRAELEKQSAEQLFKRLKKLDPARAETIDAKNSRRLIRAIEIFMATKKSSLTTSYLPPTANYEVLWLGLRPENLQDRIKKRLDSRLKAGMINEVRNLHNPPIGGGVSWKRLEDMGLEYRWISRWLIKNLKVKSKNYNSEFKISEEYNYLLRDITRYSKRQMTWFKRNKDIHWLAPSKVEGIKDYKTAERLARQFID